MIEVVYVLKSIAKDDGTPIGLLDNLTSFKTIEKLKEASRALIQEIKNTYLSRNPVVMEDYDLIVNELIKRRGEYKKMQLIPLSDIKEISPVPVKKLINVVLEFQYELAAFITKNNIKMDREEGVLNRAKYRPRIRQREEYPQTLYAFDHLLEKLYRILYFKVDDEYSKMFLEFRSKPWTNVLPTFEDALLNRWKKHESARMASNKINAQTARNAQINRIRKSRRNDSNKFAEKYKVK